MEYVAAAILGIVQGLTEFLPVSSSAHLILVPWLLGWTPEGLVFDVAVHIGTSVAVLVYFWRDWVELAQEMLRGLARRDLFGNSKRRLAWFLIAGTLPAMVAGLALEDYIESHLRSPLITVGTLTVFGLLLYYAERKGTQTRGLEDLNWGDSFWIGMSQAVALIPGVSRSGITITAAMLRDVDRPSAARYSFLLSTPIIVGAVILEAWKLIKTSLYPVATSLPASAPAPALKWGVMAVGIASAAITGFLGIRFLLRYLQSNSVLPFVIYRMILAAVVLAVYLSGARLG
jgi:undecaprenyl-diphosphatase